MRAVVGAGAGDGGPYAVDVGDEGLGEDVVRGAGGHDAALSENDQVVAVHRGEVQVVEGDDAGQTEFADQGQQGELVLDVEVVGGLVQKEFVRLLGEGAGDPDALTFAAGQGVPGPVGLVGGPVRARAVRTASSSAGEVGVQALQVRDPAQSHDVVDGQLDLTGRGRSTRPDWSWTVNST